ncbi:MAG: hypothetical protein JWM80_5328 [Cyanobacteria bacterium RYN_339]|nr:hypothetical protein [Cyanobacteria bacterium RYN_339]
MKHRVYGAILVLGLAAHACAGSLPAAAPKAVKSPAKAAGGAESTAAAGNATSAVAPVVILAGAPIISDNGGGIVSNNGGGIGTFGSEGTRATILGGQVIAPAALLPLASGSPTPGPANVSQGAFSVGVPGVVAGSMGGSEGEGDLGNEEDPPRYAGQREVGGVVVRATTVDGTLRTDRDGHQMQIRTSADGRYGFIQTWDDRAVLLDADLGTSGHLAAFAPSKRALGGDDPSLPYIGGADIDLVSTLCTVYLVDRLLPSTGDRQAALDRLTLEDEAKLRSLVTRYLAPGLAPALDRVRLAGQVDELRAAHADLDKHLQLIKGSLSGAGGNATP